MLLKTIAQRYELSFVWHRSPTGYRWEKCELCDPWGEPVRLWGKEKKREFETLLHPLPEGPFLVELHPGLRSMPWEPLANPLLFAQFADLQPDQDTFIAWANGHGRLIDIEAHNENYVFIFPRYIPFEDADVAFQRDRGIGITEKGGRYYRCTRIDPLPFWLQEYRDLSFCVMLWELALKKDSRLNGILEWCPDTERIYINKIWKEALNDIDFDRLARDPDYEPRCGAGRDRLYDPRPSYVGPGKVDLIKAAFLYLRQETNRKLKQYPLNVLFRSTPTGEPHKVIEPSSLLSAMWYQFFLAQTGEIKLRRCALCGKWENMEGHRTTWTRHAGCANYDRLKRARLKKRRISS